MDLVGAMVRDTRARQKVTLIRRESGWPREIDSRIVNGLMTETSRLGAQPTILLIWDERTKSQLEPLVGDSDFTIEVITGLDNPTMPWKAW